MSIGRPHSPLLRICLFAGCLALVGAAPVRAAPPQIEIMFEARVCRPPYTGRVYVVTTTRAEQRPLDGVAWFDCQPFFAQDVVNWAPGEVLQLDPARCLGHPHDLAQLPAGEYRVQAVLNLDTRSHDVLRAPGNAVSDVTELTHDPARPATLRLTINERLPALRLVDSESVKYARLMSRRLSAFHGRYVHMYAAVLLPESYDASPHQRFPTVYVISGFGGTILDTQMGQLFQYACATEDFDAVVVLLDADCPTGHHVFADSANNGPWGTALVEEFIPYLEHRFRLIPEAGARYVTGVSSGGWSSLWLQITHPDAFGGVWSLSPDPVDFSAFQLLDIYAPDANFLYDAEGNPNRVSRPGPWGPGLRAPDFWRLEATLGRGGQLQSFEAVFSPRGPDGRPRPLWDRRTGRIDPEVATAWKQYDIRLKIEAEWPTLGPRLRGKLHLVCGDQDEFYLERAFVRLRSALRTLGSDAVVDLVPGAGHGLTPREYQRSVAQMKATYESRYGAAGDRLARCAERAPG